MDRKIVLTDGFKISRVINGLWQVADQERGGRSLDPGVSASQMLPYLHEGLTTFDMADHYGSSELIAGHLYQNYAKGKQAQFLTKWVPKPGRMSRELVRDAVQLALHRMQQSQIDLLQFHAWKYSDPSWLDGLFYLNELRQEGLIKHLGVTNFDAIHLKMVLDSGIPLVSNQVCHSLLDQRANGALREVCEQYEVKLLAFGTLAGGFLTDKWLGRSEPTTPVTWSHMKYKRFIDTAGGWATFQGLLHLLKEIADKHRVSIANVAARWVFENPAVAAVIVGVRLGEAEHIEDNLSMLELQFDDDDRKMITSALASLTKIPGDCGDEYRYPPYLTAAGDLSDHFESMPEPYLAVNKADRKRVYSGTPWEPMAGYCRAIREGKRIWVSGTTATLGDRTIGGADPTSQTHFVIDKIEGALQSLGAQLNDVVRTRIYINDLKDWEAVARAHGQRFSNIDPANTMVQAGLIGEGYLVEVEAEAVITDE